MRDVIILIISIFYVSCVFFQQHINYEHQIFLVEKMESDLTQSMKYLNNEYLETMEQLYKLNTIDVDHTVPVPLN